jgi:4-amino-4-deoxy-L-arabinose transferase-like glycosyltransferase
VGLIALLSLALQGLIAATNLVPEYDESIYLDVSKNLAWTGLPLRSYEGGIFFFQHPTLSFLFFSLPFVAHLESLLAARAVSSVFALGTIFVTFLLGRLVGGQRIGIVAALLLAINPLFLAYSHSVYMEIILGFFLLLSAYFFVLANKQGRQILWLLSGISLGLALWVKYLAAIVVLIYLAYLFMRHRWSLVRRQETYILLGSAAGLFLLWPVYALLLDQHQFLAELRRWATFGRANLHDSRVGMALLDYAKAFIRSVSPPLTLLLVFATFRKAFSISRHRLVRAEELFPLLYIVVWVLFLILVMPIKDMRYLIPVIPWIALVVVMEIAAIAGRLDFRWLSNARILHVALVLLVVMAYAPFIGQIPIVGKLYGPAPFVSRLYPVDNGFREVGRYIAQNSASDEVITVNWKGPQFGYLADRNYRFLYTQSYPEVMEALERTRILVQDGRWFLPYLDTTQRQEFLLRLAKDFQLERTFYLGRDGYTIKIFVKKRAG